MPAIVASRQSKLWPPQRKSDKYSPGGNKRKRKGKWKKERRKDKKGKKASRPRWSFQMSAPMVSRYMHVNAGGRSNRRRAIMLSCSVSDVITSLLLHHIQRHITIWTIVQYSSCIVTEKLKDNKLRTLSPLPTFYNSFICLLVRRSDWLEIVFQN